MYTGWHMNLKGMHILVQKLDLAILGTGKHLFCATLETVFRCKWHGTPWYIASSIITFLWIKWFSNKGNIPQPSKYMALQWRHMNLKPRSHLADLTADLSRPGWSGEVLWCRAEVGKERGWVLEGPERSVNLVEVSPTIPDCFELFKTIGSGRGWRAVVDRALGSRVRSLEGR